MKAFLKKNIDLPLDEMNTRSSLNNSADLPRLKRKRSLFEFLLHFASTKEATAHQSAMAPKMLSVQYIQVTLLSSAAAV